MSRRKRVMQSPSFENYEIDKKNCILALFHYSISSVFNIKLHFDIFSITIIINLFFSLIIIIRRAVGAFL